MLKRILDSLLNKENKTEIVKRFTSAKSHCSGGVTAFGVVVVSVAAFGVAVVGVVYSSEVLVHRMPMRGISISVVRHYTLSSLHLQQTRTNKLPLWIKFKFHQFTLCQFSSCSLQNFLLQRSTVAVPTWSISSFLMFSVPE